MKRDDHYDEDTHGYGTCPHPGGLIDTDLSLGLIITKATYSRSDTQHRDANSGAFYEAIAWVTTLKSIRDGIMGVK